MMELLLSLCIYSVLLLCFLCIPVLTGGVYRVLFRRFRPVRTRSVFFSLCLVQLLILGVLSVQPVVTYSESVSASRIDAYGSWAKDTLQSRFAGVYSRNIPVLAYRFHIQNLGDGYVKARIRYLPAGDIVVQWNGLYEILQPLSGGL